MIKERECSVVLDLASSYAEGLTGVTTNGLIEGHLKDCKKCKKYYEEFMIFREESEQKEQAIGRKFKASLKRYRYQMLGMFLGIIITVSVVCGYFAYAIYEFKETSKASAHTENAEDYGTWENYYGISKLTVFPRLENPTDNIITYYYDCSGDKLYQICQIYLECEYTTQEYQEEKQRLLSIIDEDTQIAVEYDEGLEFRYPAVYAMLYDESGCYEYALFFEEDKKIVYIYLQGVNRGDLCFSTSMLPIYYGQTGYMFETEKEPFSIYPQKSE